MVYPPCFYLGVFIKKKAPKEGANSKTAIRLFLVERNVNEQTDDNQIMHVLTAQKCIGVLDVK
jgi:hypothetical protein